MKQFLTFDDVQVVGICDVDANHRAEAQGIVNQNYENKDCRAWNDFRELLSRPEIDAVTVCTPDHWHGLIALATAESGKDIYCEKPLTNTIAEGRALMNAVKTRQQPMAPEEVGCLSAVICHLLNIAVQAGKKLKWDPSAETIVDSEEANRMLSHPFFGVSGDSPFRVYYWSQWLDSPFYCEMRETREKVSLTNRACPSIGKCPKLTNSRNCFPVDFT
jgi:hypothetical protein